MTHIHPGGETRLAPPLVGPPTSPPPAHQTARPALGINLRHLRAVIAARRAAIASLEAAMVAKCEAAAARTAPRGIRPDDRATWDHAMWDRYLTAAATLEPDYLPRLLRLHVEVECLERLRLLPMTPEARAA